MVTPRTRTGKLSDLVPQGSEINWSAIRTKIKAMEPGDVLIVSCPPGFPMPQFRSTILVNGGRIHKGEWRLSTRTKGRSLHCFLASPTPKTFQ